MKSVTINYNQRRTIMSKFSYQHKEIYYEEYGSGPLVIFAHGNTASGRMFEPFIQDFAKHFHCVIIDFMGHYRSEPVSQFPTDFWYDQGMQLLKLCSLFPNEKASLIGSSGGAIAVLNAALEQPELFQCVIADSFEGEACIPALLQDFPAQREASLHDPDSILFYQAMLGNDYERIVRMDTDILLKHQKEIKQYYHKALKDITVPTLLLGSEQDDMIPHIKQIYEGIVESNTLYSTHVFPTGNHPAIFSNGEACIPIIIDFILKHVNETSSVFD